MYEKDLTHIIGLTVETIRSAFLYGKLDKQFILFTDKKTFIEFAKQDENTYHNADENARVIYVEDSKSWEKVMKSPDYVTLFKLPL